LNVAAGGPELLLALLADAHLPDGNDRRPEALALARAVAEIRSLSPPPDLVLFAGDLFHRGRPDALDLGREILADLPAPVWAVRGEGDHSRGGESVWVRRWGEPWFSRSHRGCRVIGLDTRCAALPGDRL
jgi:3',5'-cyclic AMP phosphodiesterase CpdA